MINLMTELTKKEAIGLMLLCKKVTSYEIQIFAKNRSEAHDIREGLHKLDFSLSQKGITIYGKQSKIQNID